MYFKVYEAEYDNLIFKIEEDYPEVGAYLYVYKNGICIEDFLQNDVSICKDLAYEKYHVPIHRWTEKET